MRISIENALVEGIVGRSAKKDLSELVLKVVLLRNNSSCFLRLPINKDWSPNQARLLPGQKIDVLEVKANQGDLYYVLPFANQSGQFQLLSLRHKKSIEDGFAWFAGLPFSDINQIAQSPHPLAYYLEWILKLEGPASKYPLAKHLDDCCEQKNLPKDCVTPSEEELRRLEEYLELNLTEDDVEEDPF